jgi:RNA polymerase sigma factor (TIGR02999 family)
MVAAPVAEMTDLLRSAQAGDAQASSRLFEVVYADLKRLAHARLYKLGGSGELETTALVHESFLRLVEHGQLRTVDRHAFFGYVARVMRSVVIDQVRAQQAAKRGGDGVIVTLTTGVQGESFDDERLLAMNAALDVLERVAPDYHRLVELRYFAGLSMSEVAELRGLSTRTIQREWDKARAFLRRLMQEAEPSAEPARREHEDKREDGERAVARPRA